ncbi:MAG: T9SS type A sorting domain-containing protein [Saprospiraceae bacterium]|nr:T9SS type A sorting domain-containing protein [Saprospiraceae bacterium]
MQTLTVSSLTLPTYPVKDLLIVKTLTKISTELYYSIIDAAGTEVISNKIIDAYEGLIKISVDSLKRGMYLLRISSNNSYVVASFVKA